MVLTSASHDRGPVTLAGDYLIRTPAEAFNIFLTADGIHADTDVTMKPGDWDALAQFFDALAATWTRPKPTRTWLSDHEELVILATRTDDGDTELTFIVSRSPDKTWTTILRGMTMHRGTEIDAVADDVRQWVIATAT